MFKVAPLSMYIKWLRGFFLQGGKPTHYYEYELRHSQFLVAINDFRLAGDTGANARNIIVPNGVRFLGGDPGHCTLYFMDKFQVSERSFVPIYSDRAFLELPVAQFIDAEKRRDEERRRANEEWRTAKGIALESSDLHDHLKTERACRRSICFHSR